jgi:hypothetical protein
MSEIERNAILSAMKAYTKKLKADKEASKTFLSEIGMLTKTGKLKKVYKCIPGEQA